MELQLKPSGKSKVRTLFSESSLTLFPWPSFSLFWPKKIVLDWSDHVSVGAPASEFLSWAWGKVGGDGPANFDESMTTSGEQEFWFVTCPPGKSTDVCQWK